MIRVLHILNTGRYSGAENVVITLIHTLDKTVNCAYVSPDGPIRDILAENQIDFYPVSTQATNAKELKKIIIDYKPDIIHTHDYNAGIMAVLTRTKVPIINHLHNNTLWLRKICLKSIAYGLSCLYYKRIFTVSDSVMREFIFGKIFLAKTEMLGNPIDLGRVRQNANSSISKELLESAKTDIVFLGRLSAPKNIFFLLEILRKIKTIKSDVKLSVIGDGELRTEFEEKVKEFDLCNNVIIFGFQKNPYPLLSQAKVMCMPSKWEGFGLAAVEALTLGIPVVAADVGGLSTIVRDSCGKLCKKKEEYVSEILKLLNEPDYYKQKVNGALERATELENLQTYSNQVYAEYCELIKKE